VPAGNDATPFKKWMYGNTQTFAYELLTSKADFQRSRQAQTLAATLEVVGVGDK